METQMIYGAVVGSIIGFGLLLTRRNLKVKAIKKAEAEAKARARAKAEEAIKRCAEVEQRKLIDELKSGTYLKKLEQVSIGDAVIYLRGLVKAIKVDMAQKIQIQLLSRMEQALKEKGHTGHLVLKSCYPHSGQFIQGVLDGKEISVYSDANGRIGDETLHIDESKEMFYFYCDIAIDLRYRCLNSGYIENHDSVYSKAITMVDEQIKKEEFAERFKSAVNKLDYLKNQLEKQKREERIIQIRDKLKAYL